MASSRRWLRRQLGMMAVAMYVFLLVWFATSLPRNVEQAPFQPVTAQDQIGGSSVTTTLMKTTSRRTSPPSSLSLTTTGGPAFSTVCPMRLTAKDKIPVQEYFKPLPHPVTEVVSTFLIQPPSQFCKGGLDILFLVPSSPLGQSQRDAIRETWGSGFWPDGGHGINMTVLFLLGRPPRMSMSNNVGTSVEKEAVSHGDLLVVDAEDGYRQMTVKMLAGLQWLSQRCQQVRYVARVDEDHFLNVPILYQQVHAWFQKHSQQRHLAILGKILCTYTSVVHRTNLSKHFVEFSDYPYDYFPTYLAGATYVMSAELMPRLVNVSRYVRSFTVDDAYITGVLVRVLKLLLVNLPRITVEHSVKSFVNKCSISKHNSVPDTMRTIWQMLRGNSAKCRSSVFSLVTCKQWCSTRHYKWTE